MLIKLIGAMKTFVILLLLAAIFSSCGGSREVNLPAVEKKSHHSHYAQLEQMIDGIFDDSLLRPAFVGIKIVALSSQETLYERNAEKLFHPASNMKLLTTATALSVLPQDFQFHTTISTDGDTLTPKHILNGSLYVKGSGDPLMTWQQLDSIAEQLHRRGITTINGNLVGDISAFDSLYWGSGWMWDDEPSTDQASITPLTINENSIDVIIHPGKHDRAPVSVELSPPTDFLHIINEGITSSDTTIPDLEVDRLKHENILTVKGRISPSAVPQKFSLSVWQPEMFFLNLFEKALKTHGITVHGSVHIDTAKARYIIADIVHPLDSILHQINKPSDNLAAENLLKTLAVVHAHEQGSASGGMKIVKQYLCSIGIDTTQMILADGSGLSWYNAVSPNIMSQLLVSQYRATNTFHRFYESLPIGGIDGTLKNRMKGTLAAGNVHAKTGSLTGVSSLSGYVTTSDGVPLAFSILSNHFPGDISALRSVQDKLMVLLASLNLKQSK